MHTVTSITLKIKVQNNYFTELNNTYVYIYFFMNHIPNSQSLCEGKNKILYTEKRRTKHIHKKILDIIPAWFILSQSRVGVTWPHIYSWTNWHAEIQTLRKLVQHWVVLPPVLLVVSGKNSPGTVWEINNPKPSVGNQQIQGNQQKSREINRSPGKSTEIQGNPKKSRKSKEIKEIRKSVEI